MQSALRRNQLAQGAPPRITLTDHDGRWAAVNDSDDRGCDTNRLELFTTQLELRNAPYRINWVRRLSRQLSLDEPRRTLSLSQRIGCSSRTCRSVPVSAGQATHLDIAKRKRCGADGWLDGQVQSECRRRPFWLVEIMRRRFVFVYYLMTSSADVSSWLDFGSGGVSSRLNNAAFQRLFPQRLTTGPSFTEQSWLTNNHTFLLLNEVLPPTRFYQSPFGPALISYTLGMIESKYYFCRCRAPASSPWYVIFK